MAEKAIYFSSYNEIEKRASFNSEQEISPDNFKSLVGMYRFDENVICQVRTKKGICHQKHKNGWLGITNDGVEALIGGHCASEYFKADNSFRLEKKRVESEIERRLAVEKLRGYIFGEKDYPNEVACLRTNLISARKILDSFYKSFPNSVLRFIDDAQRNQNWIINVDVGTEIQRTIKKDGEEEVITFYEWTPDTIGRLKPIIPTRDIISLINKVKELAESYGEVCAQNIDDIKTPKLKKYVERLSEKEDYATLYDKYKALIENFIKPGNLDSLIYVCDDEEEQFLTVKAIMSMTGAKVSSDGHIKLRLRRIHDRYKQQFNGKKIRKNQKSSLYKHR
ncbi:hypothetical protein [Klebsiella pneumoniae]|uniref:hypothetical protein n=1 Tax=Klebsiella pneumoniae TaxID=573 RepID=UPI002406944D|nr:hypothetical protein [Klebsiella pneumoniae]MDG0388678.1 hypothetical protein [Klebsiella pneumoniae]MDG0394234.1 hypothetical protein [Klebsiella pneumoniae]MDG0399983.1 hypothetical protein [Klebsiella pneumoniae]MDG0421313.1 hypothetical protein [Klebsiella pneumoniae]